MADESSHFKNTRYWDYWKEIVKASIDRDTKELPAIAKEAELDGKIVVDAGCGPGRLSIPFSQRAKKMICIDENDWAIKALKDKVKKNGLENKIEVIQSSLEKIPLEDHFSESTYCIWVLYYAKKNWKEITKEIVRITKPNFPIVIGFSSGELDLPLFEQIAKPSWAKLSKDFDGIFPAFCSKQGWETQVQKIPTAFEFDSPSWALEVFANTFLPKELTPKQSKEALEFLQSHTRENITRIEQELRLYTIRSSE
jgi:ubiquinone/menaquinone biosynthesis C-methylase UbiE